MRHIHLAEGVRLRFPGRSEDFDQGVEIGMVAALMDMEQLAFSRWISAASLDQVRALARQLGYAVVAGVTDGDWVEVRFQLGAVRPQLKVVHSA